jgi:hypothetical protein
MKCQKILSFCSVYSLNKCAIVKQMYLTFDMALSYLPKDRGQFPPIFIPKKRKKHVCKFCGRDDFFSRQALSYHRLHSCDKRPDDVKPEPPAAAGPPKPQTPAPGEPPAAALPKVSLDEGWRDQEQPEPEVPRYLIHQTLFFFLLLLIAVLALIVLFWDVIEREGKKFLKRFDQPAPGVTDD